MAKQVDAADLKSAIWKRVCRFDSGRGHHFLSYFIETLFLKMHIQNMQSLYKYFSRREHLENLLNEGECYFNCLSYFRDYEDNQVRGDKYEGTKVYRPQNGLEITNHTRNEKFTLNAEMTSSVQGEGIFVYCTSTILSKSLAEKFGAIGCVEIFAPDIFTRKLNCSLRLISKFKRKTILHGIVRTYEHYTEPGNTWPFPEDIIFLKSSDYNYQNEYRFAFGYNEALKPYNTVMTITTDHKPIAPAIYPFLILKIGDTSQCCREIEIAD